MESPTVHAIVTAISRRLASTPIHVYRKRTSNGLDIKERLPNHPVARLLQKPNAWQTHNDFWGDAASTFIRWGNFYAYKGRGSTGPIRELVPLSPRAVSVVQDESWNVSYKVSDSPVNDVQTAIALEILAEKFGATFFQNGAVPFLVFKFMQGSAGFRTKEEERAFIEAFQDALGGSKRFRAMLVPKGIDEPKPIPIENDKAQFLETRKYQRTVIAGAFGVPPHLPPRNRLIAVLWMMTKMSQLAATNNCAVDGCTYGSQYLSRGLCSKHYLDKYREKNRAELNAKAREKYAKDAEFRRSRLQNSKRFREKNHARLIARNAARHAAQKQRTPAWADLKKIRKIYETCPPGWHVDHIIPLQGEIVSGLHVHQNLQHLPAEENVRKSNEWSVQ